MALMLGSHPANLVVYGDGASRAESWAERFAHGFGTVHYIVAQTAVVICWLVLNVIAAHYEWDPYPFILLNLAFSTQAAYAAPLILLAQNRQVRHDMERADVDHRTLVAHTVVLGELHRLAQATAAKVGVEA